MINSIALVFLLGFELSYYLLIIQTGIVAHYNSELITLLPMFVGGVFGTVLAGFSWGSITNPMHKIFLALSLQFLLSFLYPEYTFATLFMLGAAVGAMAPLGIYLFKAKQQKELLLALAIAYTTGTYLFTSDFEQREPLALIFTAVALGSAFVLRSYKVQTDAKVVSYKLSVYLPLMLWIFLDSNLFESLSRHNGMDIWSSQTLYIIIFHLLGLVGAYFIDISKTKQHFLIALLFIGSYSLSYFEYPLLLAMLYPFTISYYNVVVFTALAHETSLFKLSFMMIFVGWIASGAGLALALSKILH